MIRFVDQNCPEYDMCPVYGELTLYIFESLAEKMFRSHKEFKPVAILV